MSRAQAVRGSPALCLHRSGAAPDSLDRAKPVSPRNFPARHGPENSGGRKASQAAGPQGVAGRGAARRRRPRGRKASQAAGPQGVAGRGAARRHRPGAARRRRPRGRKASQAGGRKASQAAVPQGAADRGGPQGAACAGLRAAGAGRCWRKYAANHAEFRRRQHL